MKYCGVVTDRSWLSDDYIKAIIGFTGTMNLTQVHLPEARIHYFYPDRPRIYSDEVPMADLKKFWDISIDNKRERAGLTDMRAVHSK